MSHAQVPELCTAEYLEPTGYQAQTTFPLPFLRAHGKQSKSKPGSPTKPVSTDITPVQDNTSKSPTMDQEMNKPFTLALSVP